MFCACVARCGCFLDVQEWFEVTLGSGDKFPGKGYELAGKLSKQVGAPPWSKKRAVGMAQRLRGLAALPEDHSWIPET